MYFADLAIDPLPQSFRHEQAALEQAGIQRWGQLRQLDESAVTRLCSSWPYASQRNLRRLRGMAGLVCDVALAPADAALLMYSGIATVRALATATPEQLVRNTGKLKRQLGVRVYQGSHIVSLAQARRWIQKAQEKQSLC